MRLSRIAGILMVILPQLAAAAPATFQRAPGESPQAFARRVLQHEAEDVTQTSWNGETVIFASHVVTEDRVLAALRRMPDGAYRKIDVTTGEEEGGTAEIRAIGFANADKDAAKELIVLLAWNVQHRDVTGTLYEVRIFDDMQSPAQAQLTYLKQVSSHFNKNSCDCDRGDGKPERFRFKTMAAIKAELKNMGY